MWEDSSLRKPHFSLFSHFGIGDFNEGLTSRIRNIVWYRQALEILVCQHSHLSTSSGIGGLVKRLNTITKG